MLPSKLNCLFDSRDHSLLKVVNEIIDNRNSFTDLANLLYPYLHPNGIKELAESKGLRIAYAVMRLMDSLDSDKSAARIQALQSLRDEVLSSADSHLPKNTGRILLQIMKELVRSRTDHRRQLELAHDFRAAVSGKPRIVRKLLREYHLLEMPEEWNHVAFDSHIHDSYTKGRKSPTHLIMDAWIKGIRKVTVVYHNFIDIEPVNELVAASEIMGVDVRVGVEFPARFYNQYVQLIWIPRGFSDAQEFITFLSEQQVTTFMEQGRKNAEYKLEYILSLLNGFNATGLLQINESLGLSIPPISPSDFLSSNKLGQTSTFQLAKFIHSRILPVLNSKIEYLRHAFVDANDEQRKRIITSVDQINSLDPEAIADNFLKQELHSPSSEYILKDKYLPELLKLSPFALIDKLTRLHSGFRIMLNLCNLRVPDVVELLYDCSGLIEYLEIFNLKDYISMPSLEYKRISDLQQCINGGSIFHLSRMIRAIIKENEKEFTSERKTKFDEILRNAGALKEYYKSSPLKLSVGSDSRGYSHKFYGMGFAVKETLPRRAQKELNRKKSERVSIPVHVNTSFQTVFMPSSDGTSKIRKFLGRIAPLRGILYKKYNEWKIEKSSFRITTNGNIVPLGGTSARKGNGFVLLAQETKLRINNALTWRYMNGNLKNTIKIVTGFIPAALTFAYTQDWWFLIYLGTPIWFAITGFRNILQSVLGGGGLRRSSLLKWKLFVNRDRIADSLLYTGLSVPLLEYFARVRVLEHTLGITTETSPVLLYSFMSFINGFYIAGHNIFRGLPREAVIGNLFRSILNIPLSILFNSSIGVLLGYLGIAGINAILEQWASIITKTSSDIVAGVIEGVADRLNNNRMRFQDYETKLFQISRVFQRLDMLHPQEDILQLIKDPNVLIMQLQTEYDDLKKLLIVNALDLLYLWMYQPRGRNVCCSFLRKMPIDEMKAFIGFQTILRNEREITQLFADGLVGNSFSRPLAFYLACHRQYLEELRDLTLKGGKKCKEFRLNPRSIWRQTTAVELSVDAEAKSNVQYLNQTRP